MCIFHCDFLVSEVAQSHAKADVPAVPERLICRGLDGVS